MFRQESWGLNALDRRVAKILDFRDGYYVELGANDGIAQSNTMILERYKGWKGLLIEPHAPTFNKLKQNRSDQNYFANCACVNFHYDLGTYRYIYSNLMSIGLDDENEIQDRKEHASSGKMFLAEGEVNEISYAKARTLNSILQEAKSPELIDFLSLDVEGAELSVLQGIDHDQYKFKFILVESRNPDVIQNYLPIKILYHI
jgi:FkbM family methyltransferase